MKGEHMVDDNPINELWVLFKLKLFRKLYQDAKKEADRIVDEYNKANKNDNPF